MSLSEIMKTIRSLNVKNITILKIIETKQQENVELKISVNRLYTQNQKQNLFKKKLMSEISNIAKTKKEYEDELKDMLESTKKIASKISIQFEEIQRKMAEKDDKTEFIDQQMKIINGNSLYKKTALMTKRLEREIEDEYYMSLSKTLMVDDILCNKSNAAILKKLNQKNKILNEKLQSSKKDLKKVLTKVELCKHHYVSYFDETYEAADKTEILKLIMSTFNQFIINGYMCYWKSIVKKLQKNSELWTVHSPSGVPVNINLPFNQTVTTFPTADVVPSVQQIISENTIKNDNQTAADDGFKS